MVVFLGDYIDGKADNLNAYKPGDEHGAAWPSMGLDVEGVARPLRDGYRPIRLLMSASQELS
jgi:hypothetical protein